MGYLITIACVQLGILVRNVKPKNKVNQIYFKLKPQNLNSRIWYQENKRGLKLCGSCCFLVVRYVLILFKKGF